ncbi:MAG TPA: LysM peptidoglycan-binding domain-containing protein [Actinomycetota bacterium]|nr:LysM peptidoglycan-binding domain-containing protein [Actinomycetota bacterium]
MAVCSEELRAGGPGAVVYRFPAARVRARAAARRRMMIRRRLVLGSVAASVIVATLLGGGTGVASRPGAPRAVVVEAGETLWDIAGAHAPSGIDPRAYVDAVVELNDLDGAPEAGQRLRLPR